MSQTTTNLQISVEEPAAWSRKLVITVPTGRVRSERQKVAQQISKQARIRGFRKGKVPPAQLEARFGAEIDRQTQQKVIDAAFREAVKVKALEPISAPRVGNVSYDREAELTFEVAFDIRPEIALSRIGGFRLTRPEVSVGDEEVDAQLNVLRRQQALWRPVERKPAVGDSVEVTVTPLEGEGGKSESRPYNFVLGERRAIPDVEAAIQTLDPESSGEFTVTFPEDFDDEEQRGESRRLRIELKQVLEQELPPLDDEFARSLGDFEDLAALREAVSQDLQRHKESEVEAGLDHQVIEQIIEANYFEVPESMIERYVDVLVGPPPEDADPDLVARARDQARPAAEWGIKRTLVIQRVAEDQDLEATKEEVQERLQELAKRIGKQVGEIRARMAKSGELRELEQRITEQKVFKYLREQSEISTGGS
ncbi:MAG: trigger factor [Gemmatimonadota bacterium]|nr:MAG: trigger factor [Gemmatimonadota bacterium]